MKKILVTGSSGLIGSEVCRHFYARGWKVHGIDNNQRAVFFGAEGDTRWNQERLCNDLPGFDHHEMDIRDRRGLGELVGKLRPDAIVHAAAQPSHDRAAAIPFDDFDTNAVGTLNLLQAARENCPESPFVFLSTNKVYGDGPNRLALREEKSRWDYADSLMKNGIAENFSIDHCLHSLFGASKAAADLLVQEFGRYFQMPTCCLRGGCLTGPNHSGVQLHGFLSYLVKCNIEEKEYRVFGYKGKQVRDNIHSADVACFIEEFIIAPKVAEVYNIGGGKENSASILEAFDRVAELTSKTMRWVYEEQARIGDHICYYSDLRKMKNDYPNWTVTKSLNDIFREIVNAWKNRVK